MILVFSATLNIRFMLKDYAQKNSSLFVLGLEERSAYLNRNLDYYNMFSYINKNLPESSYVWLIWMRNLGYYCEKDFYSDSIFEDYLLKKILANSSTPEILIKQIKQNNFTHLLYNIHFIYGEFSNLDDLQKEKLHIIEKQFMELIYKDKYYYLWEIKI